MRYVGRELTSGEEAVGQLTLDLENDDGEVEAANALAQRARATAELADALDADLEQRGATELLADVELPLVGVLAEMERAGIAADVDHLAGMSASLGGEVKAAEQAAYAVVGHEFNLGSPKQLQEVLFTELGLPKTKRIKTGYTTDSEALTSLLAQTEHPILAHLLRHRDVARLKSIVDSLIPMAGVDGRIHTTYNQTIAATGRLSSTDPNLQNIPIRTEEGRRTRQAFIVGAGYETLLTADYSQIELRIMAAPVRGQGAGRRVRLGSRLPRGDGVPGVRRAAGRRHGRAAQQDQGDELRAGLRPVLLRALAAAAGAAGTRPARSWTATSSSSAASGTTWSRSSRRPARTATPRRSSAAAATCRTWCPTTGSAGRWRSGWRSTRRSRARPPTSSRWPCSAVHRQIREQGLRSRMLLQVHDELLFEVAPGELDRLRELVHTAMCGAFELTVPLEVSMGTGRSWADAAH